MVVLAIVGVLVGVVVYRNITNTIISESPMISEAVEAVEAEISSSQASSDTSSESSSLSSSEDADASSDAEDSSLSQSSAMDAIMLPIDNILSSSFDDYTLEYDETGVTINVASEGIAAEIYALMENGSAEGLQGWETMKTNMADMSDSIVEYLETMGYSDMLVTVNVLNDQNRDNVLLCLTNGEVLYDVLAQ
ncbi:MAG: hypothetical protein PHD67_05805 [Oscillospiraceae bacterium]|nr:hypothetical protein [Oscillospiraceae bacterium]